jgi:hypothetical protein
VVTGRTADEWAFLLHRLPREPSGPRIALWRALRRLGAVLVADGVVALPRTPRTVEHLEWLAAGIAEQGGAASVWLSRPTARAAGDDLAAQSRRAAEEEYDRVIRAAHAAAASGPEARRALRRLRGELRRIAARDFFAAPNGPLARAAVESLAAEEVAV